jgi:hypothetical protein
MAKPSTESKLKTLEQAFLVSQQRNIDNTYRSEAAKNKIDSTVPVVNQHTEEIADNTNDILETQIGLAESYEETNSGILRCEEALAEIYEMIMPPEEEEGGN